MKPSVIPRDSLFRLFQQLHESLQAFANLLIEEEVVMKRLDREKIMALVEQKVRILDVFQRYERELAAVLRPWISSGSPSACWDLIGQAPEFQSVARHARFQAIKQTAQCIREQRQRNMALIRRGHYVIQEALNLVFMGLGQGPVYQGTGTLRVQPITGSVSLRG